MPRRMSKVDQVRALFREGEQIECVKNTYISAQDGSRRLIRRVGRSFADVELLGPEGPDGKPYRMVVPTRVRDVLAVDEREATYYLEESSERLRGHTVTVRRLGAPT